MRYAICYTPPVSSPLWQQGCRWLGRDAQSGHPLQQPCIRGLDPATLAELTRMPGRYGFQATLVPPFRLKEPLTETDLRAALADFAARQSSFALPPLTITQLEYCFCLQPLRHSTPLHTLAARCTRAFDRFRAPLTPSELARRKAALLSGQEKKNLELWGNPYVFEQFRFHFTLTGRMSAGRNKELVHTALVEFLGPVLDELLPCNGLCLFVEPVFGHPLRCLDRFPFSPPAPEPSERIAHDQHLQSQDLYPGYQCHPA